MRKLQWIISFFMAAFLCTAAIAADATSAPEHAKTLDRIDGTPPARHDMKDCPLNQKKEKCKYDNKDCLHAKGEPCPLEKPEGTTAAAKHDMKDCPVNHNEKDCSHKNGEPCPFEQGVKQQGKAQEKCDYMKRS